MLTPPQPNSPQNPSPPDGSDLPHDLEVTFATSSVTGRHGFPLVAKFTPGDAGEELGRSQVGCTPIPTWAPYGKSLQKALYNRYFMGYNPQESLENTRNAMATLLGVHPHFPLIQPASAKKNAMEEEDTDMDPEISSGFV